MKRVITALNAIRMNDPDRLGNWFGRFITTYRSAGDILPSQAPRSPEEVEAELANGGLLERHPWARTAWRRATRGAVLYCSGHAFALSIKDAQLLAGTERLDAAAYGKLSAKGRNAVLELIAGGFYQLLDLEMLAAEAAWADGEDFEELEEGALVVAEEVDFEDEDEDEDGSPDVEIEVFEYTQAGEGEPSSAQIDTVQVSEEGVEVVVICEDEDAPSA
ncbi:hypothetical protein D3C71_1417370 [compost metagenome]